MIRVTNKSGNYCPIKRYSPTNYRINFDKVDIEIDGEASGLSSWSVEVYHKTPTTEEVQEDVKKLTIQRYKDEGLEPPSEEDIDVSAYVITDVAVVDVSEDSLAKKDSALLQYVNDKTGNNYNELGDAVIDLVTNK